MSDANPVPRGDEQPAGGTVDTKQIPNAPTPEGSVAYETHRRLLAEKKKAQEELDNLKATLKKREEEELTKNQEWEKIAKLKEQEALDSKAKLATLETTLERGAKLQAVLQAVGGDVEQQYWPLIDVSKIIINPETGTPEPLSVQKYVAEFSQTYGKIISKDSGARLPDAAPQGGGAEITYEEYLKLPPKEMRKHMARFAKSS